MAVKIICDAASNLFPEILKEKNLDIKVMNMHLTVGDQEYNCYDEDIDIKEFSKTYYQKIGEGVKVSTSLVNPDEFLKEFEKEVGNGNEVVCFTMAKGISGTYQSALIAANEINEKYGEEKVHVVDSMTAGLGEGLQAIHACELANLGKTFKFIKKEAEHYKLYVRSDFTVDNIKYLIKTGRAAKYLAKFINLLKVKVLLKHNEESKIAFAGSVIGKKNSIKKLAKIVDDKVDRSFDQIIYITHCDVIDDALKLKQYLEEFGLHNIEIYEYDLISGAHIGPGSLAVFYVSEEEAC